MDHKVASPAPQTTAADEQVYVHETRPETQDIESQDLKHSQSSDDEKNVKELNPEVMEGSLDDQPVRPLTFAEKSKGYLRKSKPFIFIFFWMVMTG